MRSRKTIKEIAEISGFSTATVDRVINGRDGVKDETRKKILLTARQVSYKNIAVREDAASKKILTAALFVPDTDNEFINRLIAEIREKCLSDPTLAVEVHCYENLNAKSLALFLNRLDTGGIDVVGLIGVDDPQVSIVLNRMIKNDIKIITLLSTISGITPVCHIGMNDYAAGRTAGLLMSRTVNRTTGNVLVFTGSLQYQGHLQREIGFRSLMRESGIAITMADAYETLEDRSHTFSFAKEQLSGVKNIAGIYVIGSGAAEVIDAMDELALNEKPIFICHDLTESVMKKLFSGKVDYIIHQDLHIESSNFIRVLHNIQCDAEYISGLFPVRINVVTSENIYNDEV